MTNATRRKATDFPSSTWYSYRGTVNGIPEVLIFDGYGQMGHWTGNAHLVSLRGGTMRTLYSVNSWECRLIPAPGEVYVRHHLDFVEPSDTMFNTMLQIVDTDTRVTFAWNTAWRDDDPAEDLLVQVGEPRVSRYIRTYRPEFNYYSQW